MTLTAADVIDQGRHDNLAGQLAALAGNASTRTQQTSSAALAALRAGRYEETGRALLQAVRFDARAQALTELSRYLTKRNARKRPGDPGETAIALRLYLQQSTTLMQSALGSPSDLTAPSTDIVRARMQGHADALAGFADLINHALSKDPQ